jgi:hypothetical protein
MEGVKLGRGVLMESKMFVEAEGRGKDLQGLSVVTFPMDFLD